MSDHPEHRRYPRRIADVVALLGLFAIAPSSLALRFQSQTSAGPSFSCEKARTSTEKLICSDSDLSALDLEYSRLYAQRLQDSPAGEVARIKDEARWVLQRRESCSNDKLDARELRPYVIECLESWYYGRIAEFSDLPSPGPMEWTPPLIAGVQIYVDRRRGLERTRSQKTAPEIYVKAPGVEKFYRTRVEEGEPTPARVDRSSVYYVYRNIFGSLTFVAESRTRGNLDRLYFFNKDGRLAAHQRRIDGKSGTHTYVESETVFYGPAGEETRRTRQAYYDGKITTIRNDFSFTPLEKSEFGDVASFEAKLGTPESLNIEELGLCYLSLSDGYGSFARILNFTAEPLDVYERSIPKMDYMTIDNAANGRQRRGVIKQIGVLSGKRVYSVEWDGILAILVERQTNRFLPVLFVSALEKIDHLEVTKADGQNILYYSSTVPGTGHLKNDWLFVLERGVPKRADYNPVVADELKRILPEGFEAWKGEGFRLDTMTYERLVLTPRNAPCCGGSVKIVLGLQDGRFFVKSSHWEKPASEH